MKTKLYYAGAWGKRNYDRLLQYKTLEVHHLQVDYMAVSCFKCTNVLLRFFGTGLPLIVVCVLAAKYEMYDKHPQ